MIYKTFVHSLLLLALVGMASVDAVGKEQSFRCDLEQSAEEAAEKRPASQAVVVIDPEKKRAKVVYYLNQREYWRSVSIAKNKVTENRESSESCGGLCGDLQFDLAKMKGEDGSFFGSIAFERCRRSSANDAPLMLQCLERREFKDWIWTATSTGFEISSHARMKDNVDEMVFHMTQNSMNLAIWLPESSSARGAKISVDGVELGQEETKNSATVEFREPVRTNILKAFGTGKTTTLEVRRENGTTDKRDLPLAEFVEAYDQARKKMVQFSELKDAGGCID